MPVHTCMHRRDPVDEFDQQIIQESHNQYYRIEQYKLEQKIIPEIYFRKDATLHNGIEEKNLVYRINGGDYKIIEKNHISP